jgi:hypothetical protein
MSARVVTESCVRHRVAYGRGVLFLTLGGVVAVACGGNSSTVRGPTEDGSAGEAGQDGGEGEGVAGAVTTAGTGANGGTAAGDAGDAGFGAAPQSGSAGEGGLNGSAGDVSLGGTSGQTAGRGGAGGAVAGDGGTAGAISTGGTGGQAGSGGGGTAGTSGEVGVLGESCDPPGRLACAGNHQKLTLLCNQFGLWQQNETCDAGEFCSTMAGADAGICRTPAEDCAARGPDTVFCDGKSLRQCDADGLASALVEECQNECIDNACSDRCLENQLMNCSDFCPGAEPPVSCQEICGPGPETTFPATELPVLELGVEYQFWLPAVPTGFRCGNYCDNFTSRELPAAFAFKMPIIADALYRVAVDHPWRVQAAPYRVGEDTCSSDGVSLFLTPETGCQRLAWPEPYVGGAPVSTLEHLLFVFTFETTTEPARLTIELGDESLAECPSE